MASVLLQPVNLHWIDGGEDDPEDLCAHAGVEFRIGDESLVRPQDGDWNVSAAALYLLRTLSRSLTKARPVGEHLFPCCGCATYDPDGDQEVVIIGCDRGVDFDVVHTPDGILVTAIDGRRYELSPQEWQTAVCHFADVVYEFYQTSSAKTFGDKHDARAFGMFWREWFRRRSEIGKCFKKTAEW